MAEPRLERRFEPAFTDAGRRAQRGERDRTRQVLIDPLLEVPQAPRPDRRPDSARPGSKQLVGNPSDQPGRLLRAPAPAAATGVIATLGHVARRLYESLVQLLQPPRDLPDDRDCNRVPRNRLRAGAAPLCKVHSKRVVRNTNSDGVVPIGTRPELASRRQEHRHGGMRLERAGTELVDEPAGPRHVQQCGAGHLGDALALTEPDPAEVDVPALHRVRDVPERSAPDRLPPMIAVVRAMNVRTSSRSSDWKLPAQAGGAANIVSDTFHGTANGSHSAKQEPRHIAGSREAGCSI